jgi:hypothetical protein
MVWDGMPYGMFGGFVMGRLAGHGWPGLSLRARNDLEAIVTQSF